MATINRKAIRRRIHLRIRKKVNGTTVRPRLAVHFSNKNVYVQLIDDEKRCTLTSASTREKGSAPSPANVETATRIGGVIAERALALGVTHARHVVHASCLEEDRHRDHGQDKLQHVLHQRL